MSNIPLIESEIASCEHMLRMALPHKKATEQRRRLQTLKEMLVRQQQRESQCQK